jgi:hypothetical protein
VNDVVIMAILHRFEHLLHTVSRLLLVEESLVYDSSEQFPTTYILQDDEVVVRLLKEVQLP